MSNSTADSLVIGDNPNAPYGNVVSADDGIWLGLADDDSDSNGYNVYVSSVGTNGTKGDVYLTPGGSTGVIYTPGTAFANLAAGETATDTFSYTVTNGHGLSKTLTDTVVITSAQAAAGLTANADTATVKANAAGVWIGSANNDTDSNGYTLSVTAVDTSGTKGSVEFNPDATNGVFYKPGSAFSYLAAGQSATDSFSYTVSNGHGGTATAVDTVTIIGTGTGSGTTTYQAPNAVNDTATTKGTTPVTINVLGNDTEATSGLTLSVTGLNTSGTKGKAVINSNGTVTYTPAAADANLAAGTSVTDSFGYSISNGHGGTDSATVNVVVDSPATKASTGFYVATNGNDSWKGDLAAPNAAGTDGPLATLQAAQKAMEASSVKTTYIEGGNYYLSSTLSLGSRDTGESWLAMPGQTPVIHGGTQVTGWTKGGDGIWTAKVSASALAGGSEGTELYLNGSRQTDARYPNAVPSNPVQGGWLGAANSLSGQNEYTSFQFNPGDVPVLSSTAGLYVSVYQQDGWQSFNIPVKSINYSTHTISLASSAGGEISAGSRYFLFNSASLLNAPNEYYINTSNDTISYDAPAGFNGSGVTLGSVGSMILDNGAANVTIAGLTLEGSSTTGEAIRGNSAQNLTIAGDTITNTGNGITLAGNGNKIDIQGNVIEDTANYGIDINPGSNYVTASGNTIQNIGQVLNGSGIWFTGSSHDTFDNNYINNTAHTGIGGGGNTSTPSYDDTVSYNTIDHSNLTSSDGGGVYIGGYQPDTGDVISYNTITNTTATQPTASAQLYFQTPTKLVGYGIYLDDYASGVTVVGNTLNDNLRGIDIHAGSDNKIEYNSVSNDAYIGLNYQYSDPLNLNVPSSGNLFKDNLVANGSAGTYLSGNLKNPSNATWQGNFYEAAGISSSAFVTDTNGAFKSLDLNGWKAGGQDPGATSGSLSTETALYNAAAAAGESFLPRTSQTGLAGFTPTNSYDL